MKRYWKLIILVPFIVLSIGTYYVTAAGSDAPSIQFIRLQGDEREVDSVVISGQYKNEQMLIRKQGSEYVSKQSFWKWLDTNVFYHPLLDQLAQDNRSFMRGKRNYSGFYVDDQRLFYADIKFDQVDNGGRLNFRISISESNKSQQTSSSFDIQIPDSSLYFVALEDVQVEGRVMKTLVANTQREEANSGRSMADFHLYTIDLDKKSLVKDDILMSGSLENGQLVEIGMVSERNFIGKNSYAVFHKIYSTPNKEIPGEYVRERREFIAYEYATGKLIPVQSEGIEQMVKGDSQQGLIFTQGNGMLYLLSDPGQSQPHVIIYDLQQNRISKDLVVPEKTLQPNQSFMGLTRITDSRLYMVVNSNRISAAGVLKILDMDTGKIVYEGAIESANKTQIRNFSFNDIRVEP